MSPDRCDLPLLKPPLQPGERLVFEFFDQLLPVEWEIYLQPFLNGQRPDFVLLHPEKGVAVFEDAGRCMRALAASENAALVTTEKDHVRLPEDMRAGVTPVAIRVVFEAGFREFALARIAARAG